MVYVIKCMYELKVDGIIMIIQGKNELGLQARVVSLVRAGHGP